MSSYIAFDLDALNVARDVGAAAGIPEERVTHGLLRMWAWCFREKTDSVQPIQIQGFFGVAAGPALVAFGFLQEVGSTYRVRGAERYLRVSESRRKAGLARAESAGRAAGRFTSTAPAQHQHSTSINQHMTSTAPALTPNTEHRTPVKENSIVEQARLVEVPPTPPPPAALEDALTDAEFQVFEHWRQTLQHPKAKATPERKRIIAKALKTYSVEELQKAITGCTRSPHHMGQNDRGTRYDDLEVILRDAKHIEGFIRLAEGVAA